MHRRAYKKLWLAAAAAVALTACGGHSAPRSYPGGSLGATPAAAVSAGVAVNAGANSGPTAAPGRPGGAAATNAAGPSGAPSSAAATPTPTGPASHREVPLDATLSAPCVTPGGSQTLTIHGDPGWRVVYDTRYPDGKDGQVYGGIDYRGTVNSERTYVSTWVVSLAAPVGDADVEAAAVGQDVTAHKRLPFKIALHCS